MYCGSNQLTKLNTDGATLLANIKCEKNQFSTLTLSSNTKLVQLDCRLNLHETLEAGNNPKLWFIDCSDNQLTTLDLTSNTALVDFVCSNNQLSELNLKNNLLLGGLYCSYKKLSELLLNANIKLLRLYCNNIKIQELDLSNNLSLTSILLFNNPMEMLILPGGSKYGNIPGSEQSQSKSILANNNLKTVNISYTNLTTGNLLDFVKLDYLNLEGTLFNSLDVSANLVLKTLNTLNTPLTCIKVNQDQLNSIPTGRVKDADTEYSLDCQVVSVPENKVLAELIRVYPNPANHLLTVESDIPIIKVEIYSLLGNRLRDIYSGFDAININDLPEGLYIIKVDSAIGHTTLKISKK